jgi:D-alanine transaminase
MIVYLNGAYIPREEAKVSVEDRGFLFGDGVYEVIRARDGGLFTADEHLQRLQEGMRALEIDAGRAASVRALRSVGEELLERNDRTEGDATIYVQVTRGAAPRTHAYPGAGCRPTVYLSTARFAHPPGLHDSGGAAITLPDLRWTRCNLKTVNLLPNVIAKQRAVEAGAFEAMLVRDGVITEGASTNVFGVIDGRLRTYPASHYILGGITRTVILEMAREMEIPVEEQGIRVEEIPRLEELFATGTTTDVMPLVRVDGRQVGSGEPGDITRRLQVGLAERIDAAAGVTA